MFILFLNIVLLEMLPRKYASGYEKLLKKKLIESKKGSINLLLVINKIQYKILMKISQMSKKFTKKS